MRNNLKAGPIRIRYLIECGEEKVGRVHENDLLVLGMGNSRHWHIVY